MPIDEIAFEAEERMDKSIALLADQLKGVRDWPGEHRAWSTRFGSSITARRRR